VGRIIGPFGQLLVFFTMPYIYSLVKPWSSAIKQIAELIYFAKWDFLLRRVNFYNSVAIKFLFLK